jgi:hypothetical protein
MTSEGKSTDNSLEILVSARLVADFASAEGLMNEAWNVRVCYDHLGAVLADSVLQAGLKYASVVRPRVDRVLLKYPDAVNICALLSIIDARATHEFLNWSHHIKIARFERLVFTFHSAGVKEMQDLRTCLNDVQFCRFLQEINGVGPKTVDYMACLVGIDSVAVDRHIRNFARRAGVERTEYHFLKQVFCYAADFLGVPRRGFDAWVWRRESASRSVQLSLDFG